METVWSKDLKELKSKFSKYGTEQLLKSLPKKEGLEKEAIEHILTQRSSLKHSAKTKNIEVKTEETKSKPAKKFNYMDVSDEVLIKFEKAKLNKKKQVNFHCKAKDKLMNGIIVGVRLDPRSSLIQYLIRTPEGVYGKKIDSENLTFKS